MVTFDSLRREDRSPASGWKSFGRWLRRRLPTGLYARSLLIIIIPMVLLQSVVAAVFMERHWQMVTQRLSSAVTRDIAAIIEIIETYPQDADYSEIIAHRRRPAEPADLDRAGRRSAAAARQAVLLDPRRHSQRRDHRPDQAAFLDRHRRRIRASSKSASSSTTRSCAC